MLNCFFCNIIQVYLSNQKVIYKNENSLSDQSLVKKALFGDANALKAIIKNTERLVAQIIFKMVSNKADRKDIAQDVYLKTFHKLNTFKFQSKLSTWVGQIAYHTCLNYIEKKKLVLVDPNHLTIETDENQLEIIGNRLMDLSTNETEKFIFQQELSAILKMEMDKLSPLYKTLLTLYHHEELSYAEIVEITELPEGTIKNYLFRARKALRENILLTYKKESL